MEAEENANQAILIFWEQIEIVGVISIWWHDKLNTKKPPSFFKLKPSIIVLKTCSNPNTTPKIDNLVR